MVWVDVSWHHVKSFHARGVNVAPTHGLKSDVSLTLCHAPPVMGKISTSQIVRTCAESHRSPGSRGDVGNRVIETSRSTPRKAPPRCSSVFG